MDRESILDVIMKKINEAQNAKKYQEVMAQPPAMGNVWNSIAQGLQQGDNSRLEQLQRGFRGNK